MRFSVGWVNDQFMKRPPSIRNEERLAVELGAVALLGAAEEPVGGIELLGQSDGGGDVLAGDGPDGVDEQELFGVDAQLVASAPPVARRTVAQATQLDPAKPPSAP